MIFRKSLLLIYGACFFLCLCACGGGDSSNSLNVVVSPTLPPEPPAVSTSCGTSCGGSPTHNSANEWTAYDASCGCINAAIQSAANGDVIHVPAGSAIWNGKLVISKGIKLMGAGAGNTNITNNYTCSSGEWFIAYHPVDYSANHPFRISGFTFDFGNKCLGIELGQQNKNAPYIVQTNVRIDHNRFLNSINEYITVRGTFGVADNNIFESSRYTVRANPNANCSYWQYFTFAPGSADNFYFEDNEMRLNANGNQVIACSSQFSARYAFRYNNIYTPNDDWYSLFDMHGNNSTDSGDCAVMGVEIYGNNIIAGNHQGDFLDQRGGQAFIFGNNLSSTGTAFRIKAREEYADSGNPPAFNAINGQPQHIWRSYYWNNRRNLSSNLFTTYEGEHIYENGHSVPEINTDYFVDRRTTSYDSNQNVIQSPGTFNGTSGIGCGTLASRPSTCTTGVGYWATNQSCDSLTGLVGKAPSAAISGTLYRCTATNEWQEYYTPYTYPHPLRN